jgi:hypothetical protein
MIFSRSNFVISFKAQRTCAASVGYALSCMAIVPICRRTTVKLKVKLGLTMPAKIAVGFLLVSVTGPAGMVKCDNGNETASQLRIGQKVI